MTDSKTELVILRLSTREKEDLKFMAAKNNRNMSNYIRTLIDKDIKSGR